MSTNQFYFTQSKVKFVNYNYNRGVFFDEKKKRFVDFDDMDNLTYENYNKPFITYRPDLFGYRSVFHDAYLYKVAQSYMHLMMRMRTAEFGRMYVLFRTNSTMYLQPLYDFHLKMGIVDKPALHKFLRWDDASITVNYLLYVLERIKKYGLCYGPIGQSKFPDYKETLRKTEDELTDYFLYEMRKQPSAEKEYPPMPTI